MSGIQTAGRVTAGIRVPVDPITEVATHHADENVQEILKSRRREDGQPLPIEEVVEVMRDASLVMTSVTGDLSGTLEATIFTAIRFGITQREGGE